MAIPGYPNIFSDYPGGSSGSSSGGNSTAQYILYAEDTSLPNSLVLEAGTNVIFDVTSGVLTISAAATGGGATTSGSYICVNAEPSLTHERSLAAGQMITLNDNGVNSTIEVGVDPTLLGYEFLVLSPAAGLTSSQVLAFGTGLLVSGDGTTLTVSATTPTFSTFAVSGQSNVVADQVGDTATFVSGTGISITTNAGADSITISATPSSFNTVAVSGQSDLVADALGDTLNISAGTGISLTTNAATDTLTITNSSPNVNQNLFETIAVSGQSNVVADSATDTLTLAEGTGITITTNATTDTITITNASPNVAQNVFSTVSVSGQSDVVADSTTDTLTFAEGTGIDITTNAGSDTVTIANTGLGFSTIAVDGQDDVDATSLLDTLTIIAGDHITIETDASNRSITITGEAASGGGGSASDSFSTISVAGQSNIVADSSTDTLTIVAGAGVGLTTNAGTDTLTITNATCSYQSFAVSGQDSVVADQLADTVTFAAGTGMSITTDDTTDTITFTNSAPMTNTFSTVAVSGQSDVVADSTADTLTFVNGTGITITTTAGSDSVTITNSSPNVDQNIFQTVAVSGQSDIVADSTTDTLTFVAGTGIVLTTNASTDALTVTNTVSSFNTISVSGQSDVVADALADTLTLAAAGGIVITTNAATDTITISGASLQPLDATLTGIAALSGTGIVVETGTDTFTNRTIAGTANEVVVTDGDGVAGNPTLSLGNKAWGFKTISVSGQSDVVADQLEDTLTLVAGTNMTITTSAGGDSITFTAAGGGGGGLTYSAISSTASATVATVYGCNTASSNVSMYLPASPTAGQEIYIKHKTNGNTLSIIPYQGTIDGASSITSTLQYDAWHLIYTGSDGWSIF